MPNDLELLERLRAAIHEQQLAQYRAESLRKECGQADVQVIELTKAVEELDNALRLSLRESGPYYFDRHQSKMVYRG